MTSDKLRLALDIGTNSIGWCLLQLDSENKPLSIKDSGVRIFSDGRNPKDKTSLATGRRAARQMRRQRDRSLQRKRRILNQLIKMGLFPKNPEQQEELKGLDVLFLRSQAVQNQHKLTHYELGRVLLNLSKKRGFKSSRKEATTESDTKLTAPMQELQDVLDKNEALSYGDFLFQRYQKGLTTSATIENGFYPSRAIIEKEFDDIVKLQKIAFSEIPEDDWTKLRSYIFHQRPLKEVEVGQCSVFRDKKRTYQFMPSFEIYRLLQSLYNLRWRDENFNEQGLTTEQILTALPILKFKRKIKYSDIRKAADLNLNLQFTIERHLGKGEIPGCPTHTFMGCPKKGILNDIWNTLTLDQQDRLSYIFFKSNENDIENDLAQIDFLENHHFGAILNSKVPAYNDGTCAFSTDALQTIVHHSLQDGEHPSSVLHKIRDNEEFKDELKPRLSYYGEAIPDTVVPIPQAIQKNASSLDPNEKLHGKITNPTVHIALGQLRHVVNELIDRYGKPEDIHIEFARDLKLSKKKKDEISKINRDNEAINNKAKAFIEEYGLKKSAFNLEKVKLWFEMEDKLNCKCVYTGQTISARMVLSEQVEIDHILPFSRTLDDSLANKVLVVASANRIKKNQTPFEAFGQNEEQWLEILARANKLRENKSWRFHPNAIEKFKDDGGFLARQLTDTAYLSKVAKKYLGTIVPENKIVSLPGRLTALVRRRLGLNYLLSSDHEKNRNDHRHHAVDALIIGLIDRSFIQKISKASENEREEVIIPEPWESFRDDAQSSIQSIIVSHRVDHGENSRFVEETGFGLVKHLGPYQMENDFKIKTTKPIDSITDKNIDKIVNTRLRHLAETDGLQHLKSIGVKKLKMYDACKEDSEQIGSDKSYLIKVQHGKQKEHSVLYKKDGTFKMFLWKRPPHKNEKLKAGEKYKIEATYLYYYDVKKYKENPSSIKPHPAAKLLMTLHNGDSIAMEKDGETTLYQIKSLRPSNTTTMFLELYKSQKHPDEKAFLLTASKLLEHKVRKVKITPSGQVLDRGPIKL